MKSTTKPTVTIVGAGLAGAFLAVVLSKRGYNVDVYERHSQEETLENSSRRSFNITFYGYGITALKEASLWEAVKPILLPLEGSATQLTPYSDYTIDLLRKEDMTYYAVSRAELLKTLVKEAQKKQKIRFFFNTSIITIDRYAKTMVVKKGNNGPVKTIKCDVVFGADGVNSAVRTFVQQGQEANHSHEFAPWTYKQVAFTPEIIHKIGMKPNMAYSWTRKNASVIGFPQTDKLFGALFMLPKNDTQGFASLNSPDAIKQFVQEQFPVLLPALDVITESILNNPEGYFVTIRTSPWYYRDFMAVVGDAAHGFLPFYGMGTATAFGDCMELVHLLDKYGPDWGKIFPIYQENRKKNTDVIANLSEESLLRFTRFAKADYKAIYDKLESVLNAKFPKFFLPPMFFSVAHDPNRSAELLEKHDRQRKIAKYTGLSLAVGAVTGLVALHERIAKSFSTSNREVS